MEKAKRYLAECLGTMVLVLFGCGSAAVTGGANGPLGVLGIAMAFGLSIVAMAYVIGRVSGCHINPAVSLAMLLTKKLSMSDFIGYVIAQVIGAIIGAGLLKFIVSSSAVQQIADSNLGVNGFGAGYGVEIGMWAALVVEVILTFVFVFTILGVTSSERFSGVSGLVIGLTLAFVHILGIMLTGTSVNPARSIGPALFLGGAALEQLWVFIVAPLVGAALAALAYGFFKEKKTA